MNDRQRIYVAAFLRALATGMAGVPELLHALDVDETLGFRLAFLF
jgi:hypothetical protein